MRRPNNSARATAVAAAALALVVGFCGVLSQWWRAEARTRALRQESYYSSIRLADFYIEQGDIGPAFEELLGCPPEHRNWEWGYLMFLCHQDALSIPALTNLLSARRDTLLDDAGFVRAVGYRDGQLQVLDRVNRQPRFSIAVSTNGLCCLVYDPAGDRLVVAADDGWVSICEARTGQVLTNLVADVGEIARMTFTPDRRDLVVHGSTRTAVHDLASGRELSDPVGTAAPRGRVVVDPQGRRFVSIDSAGGVELYGVGAAPVSPWGWDHAGRVLDARTARERRRFATRGIFTFGGALHPGGDRLIVDTGNALFGGLGREQPCAELLDVRTGRRLPRLRGHREVFNQFAFANDGRRLMSASFDFTVRQWEALPWNATDYAGSEGESLRTRIRHYADGGQVQFPIVYSEDVRCWWERPNEPSEIKRGRVAWRGSNPPAAAMGATVRLYLSTWDNPRPELEVSNLDLVSELTRAAPFVVARTVE